jgi:hydrogenase-4 component B
MNIILLFIALNFLSIILLPFLNVKWKGLLTITTIAVICILSSFFAIPALLGTSAEYIFPGSIITGDIPIRIDSLSAWFILIINFTLLTGSFYGFYYMKAYREQKTNLSLHCISFILVHSSLLTICALQNSLAFLIAWEIMALSSFLLVIFEHNKQQTIRAGINFLIQSHISVIFLTVAFIWVAFKMNSYDFTMLSAFSSQPSVNNFILFILLFAGFAFKAGFVPFHTWLPYAHPSAPSHVSGIMSGVIIKIGIYGILRMLLLVKCNYTEVGYFILIVSVISGLYGVMLAIIQHNLKKLLAYHSIENIGIIGIGIGLGCLGLGSDNMILAALGFAGALLHTLNHSLFKSLLFYASGNVYQLTHTMNIEKLGGLIKRMPKNSMMFLIAALAICGLPPFNGFVSEFLIYSALFKGLQNSSFGLLFVLVFSLTGLVLIGGLAILCFTKAFGIVFLGEAREPELIETYKNNSKESIGKLIPMYAVGILILSIGLLPMFFINLLNEPIKLFLNLSHPNNPFSLISIHYSLFTVQYIGWCSAGFILLAAFIFLVRKLITNNNRIQITHNEQQSTKHEALSTNLPTWGCGYVAPNVKMQYTASSYVRTYRKLAEPLLLVFKKKKEINGIFPVDGWHETHPYDKLEKWLIDSPLLQMRMFFRRFAILQNGKLQLYILYGVVFIIFILLAPVIYDKLLMLFKF